MEKIAELILSLWDKSTNRRLKDIEKERELFNLLKLTTSPSMGTSRR